MPWSPAEMPPGAGRSAVPGTSRRTRPALIADAEGDGILLPPDGEPDAAPPGRRTWRRGRAGRRGPAPAAPDRRRASSSPGDMERVSWCLRSSSIGRPPRRRRGRSRRRPAAAVPHRSSRGDAREVQQVVELPHQVLELPLHGLLGPGHVLRRRRPPRQVQGAADGGHGVAQVVREPVEEHVPATDLLAEGLQRRVPAGGASILVGGPAGDDVDDHQRRIVAAGPGRHRDPLDPALPPCPVAPRRREGPGHLPAAPRDTPPGTRPPAREDRRRTGPAAGRRAGRGPGRSTVPPDRWPEDLPARPEDQGRSREQLDDLPERLRGHGITSPLDWPEDGGTTIAVGRSEHAEPGGRASQRAVFLGDTASPGGSEAPPRHVLATSTPSKTPGADRDSRTRGKASENRTPTPPNRPIPATRDRLRAPSQPARTLPPQGNHPGEAPNRGIFRKSLENL